MYSTLITQSFGPTNYALRSKHITGTYCEGVKREPALTCGRKANIIPGQYASCCKRSRCWCISAVWTPWHNHIIAIWRHELNDFRNKNWSFPHVFMSDSVSTLLAYCKRLLFCHLCSHVASLHLSKQKMEQHPGITMPHMTKHGWSCMGNCSSPYNTILIHLGWRFN